MGHYDVIIIGTGAGGGTLASALAATGKRILLLERGDFVRREKENWSSQAVNLSARYHTKEVWKDKEGADLHPHTNYFVGGNTKFYGAALFRLRKEDFGELRHHGGISPAWPVTYGVACRRRGARGASWRPKLSRRRRPLRRRSCRRAS